MKMNKSITVLNWGKISYKEAWEKQQVLFQGIIDSKMKNRNAEDPEPTSNYLIFCEHPHVYTLGKSGDLNHLLLDKEKLEEKNISFYKTNRGGDITYHGPGQMVVYPILDLENFFTDIHKYLRLLEETIIDTLKVFNIEAGRSKGETGVWIAPDTFNPRKICAMGVRCSRWVSMHGLALNVNTDLDLFNYIIPCGIQNKGVTSIKKELGKDVKLSEVEKNFLIHFKKLFDIA